MPLPYELKSPKNTPNHGLSLRKVGLFGVNRGQLASEIVDTLTGANFGALSLMSKIVIRIVAFDDITGVP